MKIIVDYWMYILPLVILQFSLMMFAIIDIIKSSEFKVGNKAIWIIICAFLSIFGPIIYFVFGREEN